VNGSTAAGARRGAPDRRASVVVETGGRRVRLKPGQAFDPATGRVRNCVGCRPPAPATADPGAATSAPAGEPAPDATAATPAATPDAAPASTGPATVAAGSP
jgi:hypothetical protein